MKNKLYELHCYLNNINPDILCITETWLNSSLPDSAVLSDSNFSLFRKDRSNGREGGGVCILVNNAAVMAVPVHVPTKFESLELVIIDIVGTAASFRLFVVYRPPSSSDYDPESLSYVSLLCECIDSLIPLKSTFVICGDFNFPKISWSKDHNILTNVNSCSGTFLNLYYKHVLTQFITQPTRYSGTTRNGSILDLVFCNEKNCVLNTIVEAPFGSSDHGIVAFNLIRDFETHIHDMSSFDFTNADWANLAAYFNNIDFFNLFENCVDSECMMNAFYDVIYTGLNQFVPVRNSQTSSNATKKVYPHKIRKLLNRKCRLWNIYRRLRTPESLNKYKSIALECRSAIYQFHVDRENKIINSGNVGKFFNYANRKFKCKSTIGPLKSADGSLSVDPFCKSELFQSVFTSSYTEDNGHIPPLGTSTADHTKIS